jgi:hypothetical protein
MRRAVEVNEALTAFLDRHWPLWRAHVGEPRYRDLCAAFRAGWEAG